MLENIQCCFSNNDKKNKHKNDSKGTPCVYLCPVDTDARHGEWGPERMKTERGLWILYGLSRTPRGSHVLLWLMRRREEDDSEENSRRSRGRKLFMLQKKQKAHEISYSAGPAWMPSWSNRRKSHKSGTCKVSHSFNHGTMNMVGPSLGDRLPVEYTAETQAQ